MASYRTQAVVLRSHRLGEIDRVITLYTKEKGLVDAVAKGARRPKGKLGGRLEPLGIVDVLVHTGRSLDVINQAETLYVLSNLRGDLRKMRQAGVIVRSLLRSTHRGQVSRELFNLLVRALMELEEREGEAIIAAFRMKHLMLLGYEPVLENCVSCGTDAGLVRFSPSLGGMLCPDCADGESERLSEAELRALADCRAMSLAEFADRYAGEGGLLEKLNSALTSFSTYHVGR